MVAIDKEKILAKTMKYTKLFHSDKIILIKSYIDGIRNSECDIYFFLNKIILEEI